MNPITCVAIVVTAGLWGAVCVKIQAFCMICLRSRHLPLDSSSEDSKMCIRVRRKFVWKDTLRAFKRPGFATDKWLMVEFVGESAIDDGGPRREYFRWGMKEVQQSNALFQLP